VRSIIYYTHVRAMPNILRINSRLWETHDWIYTYTVKSLITPTATAPNNLTLQCVSDIPVANINMLTNVKETALEVF
jgi:hypothetical protein